MSERLLLRSMTTWVFNLLVVVPVRLPADATVLLVVALSERAGP